MKKLFVMCLFLLFAAGACAGREVRPTAGLDWISGRSVTVCCSTGESVAIAAAEEALRQVHKAVVYANRNCRGYQREIRSDTEFVAMISLESGRTILGLSGGGSGANVQISIVDRNGKIAAQGRGSAKPYYAGVSVGGWRNRASGAVWQNDRYELLKIAVYEAIASLH